MEDVAIAILDTFVVLVVVVFLGLVGRLAAQVLLDSFKPDEDVRDVEEFEDFRSALRPVRPEYRHNPSPESKETLDGPRRSPMA